MFRALLWKEWRQLRGLRRVGAGLGVLLPVVALSAPAAARQGLIPLVDMSRGYSASEVILGALPLALGLGLWPLLALLTTAEAFCGDRAAGTERFLLERPVSRAAVWLARGVASAGSTLATVAASAAVWAVLASVSASPDPADWSLALRHLGVDGALATLACLLAGMLAASLLGSPLASVLLGLVLVAGPVWAGVLLSGWTPFARVGELPVGLLVPAFLILVAYPLGSFLASCGGEPAGRGRVARGAATLGAATALVLALFVVGAATAVRAVARHLEHGAELSAAPAGNATFAHSEGGWIVDLEKAEPVRFLPPPVWRASWNADGDRLAVSTMSGPLGSMTARYRIEFLDPTGQPAGKTLTLADESSWPREFAWAGSRLVVVEVSTDGVGRVRVYDPATGTERTARLSGSWQLYQLLRPAADGRVLMAVTLPDADVDEGARGARFRVHELDLDDASLAAEPLVEDVGHPWTARHSLSPTGRFWLAQQRDPDGASRRVIDLATGEEHRIRPEARPVWVRGDRLVWVAPDGDGRVVRMTSPGEPPSALRRFPHEHVVLEPSPDLRRLLVTAADVLDAQGEIVTRRRIAGTYVLDVDTGAWTELSLWPAEPYSGGTFSTTWAGPDTVARSGPATLALEDVGAPGTLRVVFGR